MNQSFVPFKIHSEKVVNKNGEVVGDDPSKFPSIANVCLRIKASLETGKDHKIIEKGEAV